jgi:hypothetical protein
MLHETDFEYAESINLDSPSPRWLIVWPLVGLLVWIAIGLVFWYGFD